ncbi:TonB-dependent receptor [Gramella sp. GC03-9]|uniref:TonB-dependent receptor n=2 Tax=Christiangramia oceanisediminis TaxID=2920386 RepID=A0A9X2KZ24_9FLAO|nr:TonB-dependent receptor [Gramella oceanisediminis]MCP9200826.1 TonB-dependent receptor [Gramella oceanisediminis]
MAGNTLLAQNQFETTILNAETNEPLYGVSIGIQELNIGTTTNEEGKAVLRNIPDGEYDIEIRYIGFETRTITRTFPLSEEENKQEIRLQPSEEQMETIVIESTRSSRTFEDIPTRIEFIAGEELAEKGNMKPGDIRMLLNESTGIQTQQTSATSYNSSIRIQGLDGKYTQLLRDGLPLYSGYSGGLSLMQIAPLDLKQVEVIKGASSTLYGGGAIAGLVNLISKTPEDEQELSFMANLTSALGLDLSGFYSEKFGRLGTTVFASYNLGTPYDPADNGLTAIPKFERFTLNPRLFVDYDENTDFNIGFNFVSEDRLGGAMDYVENESGPGYFERNDTQRFSTQLLGNHRFSDNTSLQVKNSISLFEREIEIPDYAFTGYQVSSFSEVNLSTIQEDTEWIGGLNLWTEDFDQEQGDPNQDLSFSNYTIGAFVQNTWDIEQKWTLETGLRGDYQSNYGFYLLPRFSLMFEPSEKLTFRAGGGMGYKTPSIFTEEVERLQFQNVLPIDADEAEAERSIGFNVDGNYKWAITNDLNLSTNLLFFYTRINDPLVLNQTIGSFYEFTQPGGYIDSKGIEANMRWSYQDLKLFVGYTLADVNQHLNDETEQYPLVAQHRLNNVLMYEKHDNFWIGLEGYYYSSQELTDGSTGEPYWILGVMTEKRIGEKFSVFLNFENILDTRQSRFDTVFTGTLEDPNFRDIYAPVDGFVINGGFKLNL